MKSALPYEEVKDCHTAGMTPWQISENVLVSLGTVYKMLGQLGLSPNKKKRGLESIPDETLKEMGEYIEDAEGSGESVRSIARRFKVKYHLAKQIADQMGYRSIDSEKLKENVDKAVEMYVAGASLYNIRRATRITSNRLYDTLHDRGIPLRTMREGLYAIHKDLEEMDTEGWGG